MQQWQAADAPGDCWQDLMMLRRQQRPLQRRASGRKELQARKQQKCRSLRQPRCAVPLLYPIL